MIYTTEIFSNILNYDVYKDWADISETNRSKDYRLCLRQPTLPLRIRINTGSLYRNVSILNYKRDKDNVS